MDDIELTAIWGADVIREDILESDRWFTNEDRGIGYTCQDGAGDPVVMTGWALSWVMKRNASDADASAILTKTTAGGGITLTSASRARVVIAAGDTDGTVRPRQYWIELKRTDAGNERVLARGLGKLQRSAHIS